MWKTPPPGHATTLNGRSANVCTRARSPKKPLRLPIPPNPHAVLAMTPRETRDDRRSPQSEGRRRQDDAGAAPRRQLGRQGKDGHADRCGPAGLGPGLVAGAWPGGTATAVRRHRSGARHAASGGPRVGAERRPHRHRRAAACRRADAVRVARRRPGADPGAAIAARRLGFGRDARAGDRGAHLPARTRRPVRSQSLRRAHRIWRGKRPSRWPITTRRCSPVRSVSASPSRMPRSPGRIASELDEASPAAREIAALAAEIERLDVRRAMP